MAPLLALKVLATFPLITLYLAMVGHIGWTGSGDSYLRFIYAIYMVGYVLWVACFWSTMNTVIREEKDKGLPGFIDLIGIESPGLTASPAIAEQVTGIVNKIL